MRHLGAAMSLLFALPASVASGAPQSVGKSTASWARLRTASHRLAIQWRHAVPRSKKAMQVEPALRELRGGDPRPLLLLRECGGCDARIHNLLDQAMKSERFQLASHWFRCVRVPGRVVKKEHPYHALFSGKRPPHLIFATRDGKKVVPLLGSTKQKVTWRAIAGILKDDYKRNPTVVLREYQMLLDQLDALDAQEKELLRQIDEMTAKKRATKVKRLESRLERTRKERRKLFFLERALKDLSLRPKERGGSRRPPHRPPRKGSGNRGGKGGGKSGGKSPSR